jgi:hypothetical protein
LDHAPVLIVATPAGQVHELGALLAGGRALPAYREALEKVGALSIENLAQLGSTLDNLRKPARKAKR